MHILEHIPRKKEKNVCLEEIGMWSKIGNHFKLNSQLNWEGRGGPMGLSYGAMTLNFENL